MMNAPKPLKIELHTKSQTLELVYSDTESYQLSGEYLRVYSPSAEVKGHGPGQGVLQTGKIDVTINLIQLVGNYAIQLFFSDGHDSGIYTWSYLYELSCKQEAYWQAYLTRLHQAGASRDPDVQVLHLGN